MIGILGGLVLSAILLLIFNSDAPWVVKMGGLKRLEKVEVLGTFFLNALRMIVVPLVMVSVTVGIIRMGDIRKIKGIGYKTLAYYLVTTAISVTIGIILVSMIKPGVGVPIEGTLMPEKVASKVGQGWDDILLSFVHQNLFGAMSEPKMLPLIVFSIIFAGIITTLGDKGKPLIAVFEALNVAIMKFVHLIMWLAPIGIFGLVTYRFAAAGGPEAWVQLLENLGKYMGTVLLGLGIHAIIVLPLLCIYLGRRNPISHFIAMFPALLTAWSTASSSATLPLTMECAEERAKIRPRTAGFVLPIGATINMDGTALYEAVAAVFIAQAYGIELSGMQLVLVFITATLVSIGAAGVPEAGLFMMVIVLQAVNLPIEGIGLILAVDWLLDRFRTSVNVWGDSIGAAFIDNVVKDDPAPTEMVSPT